MKVKIIFTVVGVILLLFGLFGFFMMFATSSSEQTGLFDDQKPLYSIKGIAVDSKGNLYYGIDESSSIQVYDNECNFLYRISFKTGGAGYFAFYIDSDDIIHIATARANCVYSFYNGDLLDIREYADSEEESDTINAYERLQKSSYFDSNGNRYDISGSGVKMYDINGVFIRNMSPNAPVWPFTIFMYWGIAALGMIIVFLANVKFIINTFKQMKIKY